MERKKLSFYGVFRFILYLLGNKRYNERGLKKTTVFSLLIKQMKAYQQRLGCSVNTATA
nr:hypothetical protein [uncultured Acetobacterium sp.]